MTAVAETLMVGLGVFDQAVVGHRATLAHDRGVRNGAGRCKDSHHRPEYRGCQPLNHASAGIGAGRTSSTAEFG